jgi:sialate O-acetylesterase
MNRIRIFISISLFIITGKISAEIILPSIFADGMVFQQSSNAPIWGKASPGNEIKVKTGWDNINYSVKVSADSIWKVWVKTPEASFKPYEVILSDKNSKIALKNVLIGEVWLCSGQSNMEMPMKGFINQPVDGAMAEILAAPNNAFRCFTLEKQWSYDPQFNCKGKWEFASPEGTPNFTATGYFFGKYIQQVLNVPVGLLNVTWGGSCIEAWMSRESLTSFSKIQLPEQNKEYKGKQHVPTYMYNGMLNTVIGFPIRGAIWYQGETNRNRFQLYPALFAAMQKDWQNRWNCGEFPIYFCQIAPYKYDGSDLTISALMREAQLQIAQNQPKTGIAILSDVGDENCIHPSNKKVAGQRLALQALAKTYNYKDLPYQSPEYKSVEFKDGKAYLTFQNAPQGIIPFSGPVTGFEIAGEDKHFESAVAMIEKGVVLVSSPVVANPVAVRYMFKNFAVGNLAGTNGLPVSSFRTDNWDN